MSVRSGWTDPQRGIKRALWTPTLAVLTMSVALMMLACSRDASGQELRAFWADAFSEGVRTRAEIDALIARLQLANCNAIFAQMRKGGDAYYASRYDPWASDNPERFDALQYLIEKAHAAKPPIAVHAWLNTCAVGRTRGNPWHVAARRPDWLSLSDKGETYDGEATKIDPGHPEAADLTFRVYLDVARRYDVDGIHLDFVRYGGANWGYNPVSVARFNARHGRSGQPQPNDPAWQQWRRDQVTALVRRVYVSAVRVRPKLIVSAATITWGKGPESSQEWSTRTAAMTRVFQDWRAWMQEGILDLNCMMSYYSEQRYPQWFRLWVDWAKDHQYSRWAVPSSGVWLNTIDDSLKQIAYIRRASPAGNRARGGVLLYCYAGTNRASDGSEQRYSEEFYAALSRSTSTRTAPFARPSAAPTLPWKAMPKLGHIQGYVLDANSLLPCDGLLVRLAAPANRIARTDGTGHYAFIDVAPGRYRLTASGLGYSAAAADCRVEAGRVAIAGLMMGRPSTPYARSMREVRKLPADTPVRLTRAVVVEGTDVFIDRLFAVTSPDDDVLQVRLPGAPTIPIQAGDEVALLGRMSVTDGEPVLVADAISLVGMTAAPPESDSTPWNVPDGPGAAGILVRPGIVRARGVVRDGPDGRPRLATSLPIDVVLSRRKDRGVEDMDEPLPRPANGAEIEVTGVAVLAGTGADRRVLLYPRAYEDVREVQSRAQRLLKLALRYSMPPFRRVGPLPIAAR